MVHQSQDTSIDWKPTLGGPISTIPPPTIYLPNIFLPTQYPPNLLTKYPPSYPYQPIYSITYVPTPTNPYLLTYPYSPL